MQSQCGNCVFRTQRLQRWFLPVLLISFLVSSELGLAAQQTKPAAAKEITIVRKPGHEDGEAQIPGGRRMGSRARLLHMRLLRGWCEETRARLF